MFGPKGEPPAAAGAGALTFAPQQRQAQDRRRWRSTTGVIGGISIRSNSEITSPGASAPIAAPQPGQRSGR